MSEGLMVASQHAYRQTVMFTRADYRTRFEREPIRFPRSAYNARFEREPSPMKQEAGRRAMFRCRPVLPALAATAKLRALRSRAASILYYGL